jgi:hypothetical protein
MYGYGFIPTFREGEGEGGRRGPGGRQQYLLGSKSGNESLQFISRIILQFNSRMKCNIIDLIAIISFMKNCMDITPNDRDYST